MIVKKNDAKDCFAADYLNVSLLVCLLNHIYEFFTKSSLESSTRIWIQVIIVGWIFVRVIKTGRIKINHFFILISTIWAMLIVFSYIFFHPADYLLNEIVFRGISHILIPVYLISIVSNMDIFVESLKKYMPLMLLYCLMQFLYKRENFNDDYFTFTYSILPIALLLFAIEKETPNIKYGIISLFVAVSVLLFGTRSALLCIGIEFIILFYLDSNQKKRWLLFFISVIAISLVLVFYDDLTAIFINIFPNARISAFLSGKLVDNSRSMMWGHLLSKVLEDPFTIHGILSDRVEIADFRGEYTPERIRAYYAHNFIVEILYDFGALGAVFLLFLFWVIYKAYRISQKYNDKDMKILFAVFISYFIGKLSVSSSFLFDFGTGYLVGILYLIISHHKRCKELEC